MAQTGPQVRTTRLTRSDQENGRGDVTWRRQLESAQRRRDPLGRLGARQREHRRRLARAREARRLRMRPDVVAVTVAVVAAPVVGAVGRGLVVGVLVAVIVIVGVVMTVGVLMTVRRVRDAVRGQVQGMDAPQSPENEADEQDRVHATRAHGLIIGRRRR